MSKAGKFAGMTASEDFYLIRVPKPAASPPPPGGEKLVRVNFELTEANQRKLKINVARSPHKSIKDFLTAYIESLPD